MPCDRLALCDHLVVRTLGKKPYLEMWEQMKAFVDSTTDVESTTEMHSELWLLEHPPVFTLGQAAKKEYLLDTGEIPVIQVDRGGQVTYHGPGQLMGYVLLPVVAKKIGSRLLVSLIEQTIIETLSSFGMTASTEANRPGIYILHQKIASIGLRIRKGYSYHGFALNICMDLTPFERIHPCGEKDRVVTHMQHYLPEISFTEVLNRVIELFKKNFQYATLTITPIPWQEEIVTL